MISVEGVILAFRRLVFNWGSADSLVQVGQRLAISLVTSRVKAIFSIVIIVEKVNLRQVFLSLFGHIR
ncbi:MAG: hypothetical protein VX642_04075 [Bdellovibrionota bacterium]|nr:hypothetical protein [Bdellovibrionota bacterium]